MNTKFSQVLALTLALTKPFVVQRVPMENVVVQMEILTHLFMAPQEDLGGLKQTSWGSLT